MMSDGRHHPSSPVDPSIIPTGHVDHCTMMYQSTEELVDPSTKR